MSGPVLGVLGGGQLGRMLAEAAAGLGVRTRVFDPSPDACAGQVAELVVGEFDDRRALAWFCDGLTTATVEFENVPIETARFVAERVSLYPGVQGIAPAQDRTAERALLARVGFGVPRSASVDDAEGLGRALAALPPPVILKSRRLGYDGKGQAWIRDTGDAGAAWAAIGGRPAILDEAVSFSREISLLAVRGRDGAVGHYAPVENVHLGGMLHTSRAPAEMDPGVLARLRLSLERLLEAVEYVGVLAVEFFEVGGVYLANEYAPRVHNSGHWTIEGAATSQFENHVRAALGMPVGPTEMTGFAGMVNLIGSTEAADAVTDGVHVHRYGKGPRAGRKVGHITVIESSPDARDDRLREIAALVAGR